MQIMRLLPTSLILEFIVMSAPLPKFDKTFLLANNFGTGNRIKFGCWNYPPFSGNKSIITQCNIIQPRAFFKKRLKQIHWGYLNLEQTC